ncbi:MULTISPECIES: hypothetical protein [Paenibacillus]|uniref:hypothetical protein n=1 Tax=Paenibacillus TaxID=44249 RepID=UPI002FE1897F
METLFFNSQLAIGEVVPLIFKHLNVQNVAEGENSSYLNEMYFSGSVIGLDIRISENNYDYEDKFNYMISIKKSIGTVTT